MLQRTVIDLSKPRFVEKDGAVIPNPERKRVVTLSAEEEAAVNSEWGANKRQTELDMEHRDKRNAYESLMKEATEKRTLGEPVDAKDISKLRALKAELEE